MTLVEPVAAGENVRHAGEDMRAGDRVLLRGHAASAPASSAPRWRPGRAERPGAPAGPRVAGALHRRRAAGPRRAARPGRDPRLQRPDAGALATRAGADASRRGALRDDRAATEHALAAALEHADVVVVSGGVSVGPHDHVKPALAALGVERGASGAWRCSPGKPTWFGMRGGKLVFGLPGNPVSAFVTFSLFARPALAALQGADRAARHRDRGRARRRRSGATPTARGDARAAGARRRRDRGDPQRPAGLAHHHLAARRRRARADRPAGEGEAARRNRPSRLEPLPSLGKAEFQRRERPRRAVRRDRRLLFAAPATPAADAGASASGVSAAHRRHVIAADGAVRSVQSADITLARSAISTGCGRPSNLERLARTYWRFLTRVTLGLIRVDYGEDERYGRARCAGRCGCCASRRPSTRSTREPRQRALADRGRPAGRARAAAGDGFLSDRRPPRARRPSRGPTPRCTSRSRSRTSIRRSPPAQHAGVRARSRRSTCSSRTASCARWATSTSPSRASARSARRRRRRPTQPRAAGRPARARRSAVALAGERAQLGAVVARVARAAPCPSASASPATRSWRPRPPW